MSLDSQVHVKEIKLNEKKKNITRTMSIEEVKLVLAASVLLFFFLFFGCQLQLRIDNGVPTYLHQPNAQSLCPTFIFSLLIVVIATILSCLNFTTTTHTHIHISHDYFHLDAKKFLSTMPTRHDFRFTILREQSISGSCYQTLIWDYYFCCWKSPFFFFFWKRRKSFARCRLAKAFNSSTVPSILVNLHCE